MKPMRVNNLKWIAAVLMLGSVSVAWASPTACASPQLLNGSVVGPSSGCSYLDANFDNFSVAAASGNESSNFPTTAAFTGGTGSNNVEFIPPSGTTTFTLDFQTVKSSGTGADGTSSCTTQTWCVAGNSSGVASQSLTYDVVRPGGFDSLSLSDGTFQTDTVAAGSVITTEERFCLGSATFNCSATSSNYGYLEIQQHSAGGNAYDTIYTVCTPGAGGCTVTTGSSTIDIARTSTIAIQDTVLISTSFGSGAWPVFLDSFNNNFDTAPEPSTFMLLGIALAGLVLVRLRQKKA